MRVLYGGPYQRGHGTYIGSRIVIQNINEISAVNDRIFDADIVSHGKSTVVVVFQDDDVRMKRSNLGCRAVNGSVVNDDNSFPSILISLE